MSAFLDNKTGGRRTKLKGRCQSWKLLIVWKGRVTTRIIERAPPRLILPVRAIFNWKVPGRIAVVAVWAALVHWHRIELVVSTHQQTLVEPCRGISHTLV